MLTHHPQATSLWLGPTGIFVTTGLLCFVFLLPRGLALCSLECQLAAHPGPATTLHAVPPLLPLLRWPSSLTCVTLAASMGSTSATLSFNVVGIADSLGVNKCRPPGPISDRSPPPVTGVSWLCLASPCHSCSPAGPGLLSLGTADCCVGRPGCLGVSLASTPGCQEHPRCSQL